MQADIETINQKRKFSQINEYENIQKTYHKIHGAFSKNIDLEKECLKLENEIEGMN